MSSGHVLAMGTLAELRDKAALPVFIKPKGLNGWLYENSNFQSFLQADEQTLAVPESEKITVLKQLLSNESLTDINVESANLEKLYQYYLKSNGHKQNNQNSGASQ